MSKTYDYFKQAIGSKISEDDYNRYIADIEKLVDEFPSTCDSIKSVLEKEYKSIFVVGIGDSLYSAGSTRFASQKILNQEIRVLESMEFNYYYKDFVTKDSLVVICSGGGQASRTVESYYIAKQQGAQIVALTLSPHSRLKSACEYSVCFEPDRPAYVGGSCNYMVLAAMLQVFFVMLAKYRNIISSSDTTEFFRQFVNYAKIGMKSCMNDSEDLIRSCMKDAEERKIDKFYFLGAGPGFDLALYGAAKIMEEAAIDGIVQQTEEYGHEQYWVHNRRGKNDFMFMIAPAGHSVKRTIEYLDEMNFLNLNTVVLTSGEPDKGLSDKATYLFSTTESIPEDFYWLAGGHILARFANFFTEHSGFTDFKFRNEEQKTEHYKTIQFSRFCDELSEFDVEVPDDKSLAESGPMGKKYNL
jgi:glucosamine 6-phosphate synthetase-like amidotransferase/phosphosugar isomerase protein